MTDEEGFLIELALHLDFQMTNDDGDEFACSQDQLLEYARRLLSHSILAYYRRQIEWSGRTFGPALRTKGIIDHIKKELREIEADPHDLSEWVDVIILAMDGFWRHGGTAEDLMPRLLAKQEKNFARNWPDWRTMPEDRAIEHDRSGEQHPDDIAVDRFAVAMKAKLKWEREARGRSGWQEMSAEELSRILYEHLPKGDPVDVANLCMMLSLNGQRIVDAPEGQQEATVEAVVQAVRPYTMRTLFIDEHRELVRAALKAAMEARR